MSTRFAALDFETANTFDPSICAAGVAIFEDGKIKETLYWLVRPPKGFGYFRPDFTECHGLRWFDVQDEPEFPVIAAELLPQLASVDIVIAHNAQFDMGKLAGTLEHFGLPCPTINYLCTLQLARRVWPTLPNHQLDTLAEHAGHQFHHHHAGEDAEAAGRVLLAMMKHAGVKTPNELCTVTGVEMGRL